MLMQQHYKHKTISKATMRPEVTFQSSCQRSHESKNSTVELKFFYFIRLMLLRG